MIELVKVVTCPKTDLHTSKVTSQTSIIRKINYKKKD